MNTVVSDGVQLAYRVDGPDDAPAIVLVNSVGTNLRMWDPQLAFFSTSLRVVRSDCRGHGASEVPPGPYTMEQLGHDLLALLDTLHIERAHLCGISLGGMIALWLAATYPDRVNCAVFANTAARIGTVESWNARIDAVQRGGMGAIRAMVLSRFLSAGFRQSHPEVEQRIGEMVEATDPKGYIGACEALRDTDLRAVLPAIQVPSLILAGELDESTPPSQALELHSAIAGSELVVLPEVAHLSNVEQPEEFSTRVLAFLNGS